MRRFPILALYVLLAANAYAAESDLVYPADNAPRTKDFNDLRNYLRLKREEPIADKVHALSITGEVRPEVITSSSVRIDPTTEIEYEQYGILDREPKLSCKSLVSLFFDYRVYQTSLHLKLKFENPMGIVSGEVDNLTLEQAYMRQRILEDGKSIFDISCGRNKLYNIFDSKVQFNALIDGITIEYTNGYPKVFDLQLTAAGGIVSQQFSQYGWVGEIGLSRILGTGFFIRYSFSDWLKKGESPIVSGNGVSTGTSIQNNPQFAFQISQITSGWDFKEAKVKLYYATLFNNAAKSHPELGMQKLDRMGWYAGFQLGRIEKAGDIALDINYQWVGAQAVPGWDMSGIGCGNPGASSIYYPSLTGDPAPFGNTNYRGWAANYMHACDDTLSLVVTMKMSRSLRHFANWKSRYAQAQAMLVYIF